MTMLWLLPAALFVVYLVSISQDSDSLLVIAFNGLLAVSVVLTACLAAAA